MHQWIIIVFSGCIRMLNVVTKRMRQITLGFCYNDSSDDNNKNECSAVTTNEQEH